MTDKLSQETIDSALKLFGEASTEMNIICVHKSAVKQVHADTLEWRQTDVEKCPLCNGNIEIQTGKDDEIGVYRLGADVRCHKVSCKNTGEIIVDEDGAFIHWEGE